MEDDAGATSGVRALLTRPPLHGSRLLSILDALDIKSFRQELSVIKIEHADASTLSQQLSEIYGAEVAAPTGGQTAAQRRSRARRRVDGSTAAGSSTSGAGAGARENWRC